MGAQPADFVTFLGVAGDARSRVTPGSASVRAAIAAYAGSEIAAPGLDFAATFADPDQALAAAVEVFRSGRTPETAAGNPPPAWRLALYGDPQADAPGKAEAEAAVHRLARMLALPDDAPILCTAPVRAGLAGPLPDEVTWRDLGECRFADVVRPLHLYEIWPDGMETAPLAEPESVEAGVGPAPSDTNPYKGLRAFGEADEADFFGREALTARLQARLAEPGPFARFLAVVGPAGSGKTSVVEAGLLPALRRAKPAAAAPFIVTVDPGATPMQALAAALATATDRPAAALLRMLLADDLGIHSVAEELLAAEEDGTEPVAGGVLVVLDPFESLFTAGGDAAVRRRFLAALHRAVTMPGGPTSVVAVLRAGFYDRPLLDHGIGELMQQRTEVVLPLTSEELGHAVAAPAARTGVAVDPELVAAIQADVEAHPDALPLVEYALAALYPERTSDGLTATAYQAAGKLDALARRAEAFYTALGPAEQEGVRQVFLALSRPVGSEDGRPGYVPRGELDAVPLPAAELDQLLERLSVAGLVTLGPGPRGHTTSAALAHDVILRTWPRLTGWIATAPSAPRTARHAAVTALDRATAAPPPPTRGSDLGLRAGLPGATTHLQPAAGFLRRRPMLLRAGLALVALILLTGLALMLLPGSASLGRVIGKATAVPDTPPGAEATATAMTAEAGRLARLAGTLDAQLSGATALRANAETIALLSIRSLQFGYTVEGDAALSAAALLPYSRQILTGGSAWVTRLAISPDGHSIFAGGADGQVRVWTRTITGTLQTLPAFNTGRSVLSAEFAADNRQVLLGSIGDAVEVWDTATGKRPHALTLAGGGLDYRPGSAAVARFILSDTQVLVTSQAGGVAVWDLASDKLLPRFTLPDGASVAATSPDTRFLLVAQADRTVWLWDAQTGAPITAFNGLSAQGLLTAAIAADDREVLVGRDDGSVELWDASGGAPLLTFRGGARPVQAVAFSPDGSLVAASGEDRSVYLWDRATGALRLRLTGHTATVNALAFTPDSRTLVSGAADGTVRLWDVDPAVYLPVLSGHTGAVRVVAASPDGATILTAGADQTARLWDAHSGTLLQTLPDPAGALAGAAWAPDGKAVVTGSGDGTAHVWDAQTGIALRTLALPGLPVLTLAVSPDGQAIVTGNGDGTARVWDAATGQELQRIPTLATVQSVAFSPDGRTILTGQGDGSVTLWDRATGAPVRHFTGHPGGVSSVAFAPDGKTILTGGADQTARLWDVATGAAILAFTGHTGPVRAVAFAPDGRTILTGSDDGTARLWDAATGAEIRRLTAPPGSVPAVAFLPDGQHVVTGYENGTARVWDVDYGATIRYLCSRLQRDLTADERALYGIVDNAPTCRP